MEKAIRVEVLQALQSRRDDVAEGWYRALSPTCFVPLRASEVRQRLAGLTDLVIQVLLAGSFDQGQAREIGHRLAELRFIQPEALGCTQSVLARCLPEALPPEQVALLYPRLASLLEGVAIGLSQRACDIILDEQEQIRSAFVAELKMAEKSLREAHDELEVRVQQRTEELARTNEELQIEVSERKWTEERLRESEGKYRALVENISDVIYSVDVDGFITYISPSVESVLGYSQLEVLTHHFKDFILADDLPLLDQSFQAMFAGRSRESEYRAATKSGEVRWIRTLSRPIFSAEGVIGVHGVFSDITERKQVDELKDNLIRDVSHELRTPLAKMQMSLELLLEMLGQEQVEGRRAARIGEMVYGNVRRLLQTVEAILDLSSLEVGHISFAKMEILPADLVNEASLYMKPIVEAKGLELETVLPEELSPIEGDWEQLFRVMINLLDNAIKFSEEGKIVVAATAQPQYVEFSVGDTGCGIRQENLPYVFDRFYQERARFDGAGVGLTICARVVEAHGGRIWAESPGRGQGATLRFTLPILGQRGGGG